MSLSEKVTCEARVLRTALISLLRKQMYDSFLVSVSSSYRCVRRRHGVKTKKTYINGGYNPFTPCFETSFTPMREHNPPKTQKMGGGREPRRCDKIGKHGWGKWSREGVLVIRKWGEGHPVFQSVMEIFGLVVSDLLEYGHHQFKLVLGHRNRGRKVGLLSLGFGTTLGVTGARGDSPLSTSALSTCLFVVLV